ncbi:MAG: GH3 auxin-responsive promoter family protein [Candidatus Wallbacteria bacterium]|nr:GH3 auxin-responsive promoter family protein [Candidatus Wallbacteria bacterium]
MEWSAVKNRIFTAFSRKIEGDTFRLQENALLSRIDDSRDTKIYKKFSLGSIRSVSDYWKRVQIQHYEDIREMWEQEAAGRSGAAIREKAGHFGISTGTTGKPKLIPVPGSILKDFRKKELYLLSLFIKKYPNSKVLDKKILAISGCSSLGLTTGGIPYGPISGILAEAAPHLMKRRIIPCPATINIQDWNEKTRTIAREIKGKAIGSIFGIPASILDFLEKARHSYFTRSEFASFARNLEVIYCTGVNYRTYDDKIYAALGKKVSIIEYYAATEGIFGHQSPDNPESMLFFTDHNFYEFIPFDDYQNKNYRQRKLITELSEGVEYVPAVTTGNGAFSYVLGDVIQCLDPKIPLFQIMGRTVLTLNLTGEKTSIHVIEKTVENLSVELKSQPGEFLVLGKTGPKPRYLWVFEKNEAWEKHDPEWISARLDKYLQENSSLYRLLYKNFDPAEVRFVDKEKFQSWLEKRKSDFGHSKMPRIIRDPALVEEIIGYPPPDLKEA